MAISQEQVDAWFAANPNATAEDVAAAVQSIGGLEANQGLAGMIANRYSIAEPEVTNYYNAYTAPKVDTPTFTDTITSGANTTEQDLLDIVGAPTDNITSTGGYTKSATQPTSGGVSGVIEGDDIDTQIAQLPEEYASWHREGPYMVLIRKSDGAELDREYSPVMSDVDLLKTGLSFVPGAGQVLAAVNIADALRTGNLTNAAIGATGLGGYTDLNTALRVGQAVDSGNTLGALTALAGNTNVQNALNLGDANVAGLTVKDATAAANLVNAANSGNVGAVVSNLGTLTDSSDTRLAGQAITLIQAIDSGNTKALTQAVSLANNILGSTSGSTGSTGSTTVGDFEDTEVTRLKGLGYTNQQIQDYFNNLDNLTGAFDDQNAVITDTTTGSAADTANLVASGLDQDTADFLASIGITSIDQLADSGLSNQDILDLIGAGDDELVVTDTKDTDTVTGGDGNDLVVDDKGEVVIKDKKESCPVGTVLNPETGECDPITEVDDKGEIVIKDTKESCPIGTVLNPETGECDPIEDKGEIVIKDKKEFCPVGTVLNPETGNCDPIIETPAALDCPEGYEPNEAGTACIPVVEIKDMKCDPGYVYDEDLKQCVAIKGEDECPTGYHRDEVTGACVPDETKLECPEGYEPNEAGTACIPVIEIKDKKCDPGYVYDEDLKQCVPIKGDEPCAEGFHLENGLCVPDGEECEDGYEKVNGACVPVCKEGYVRNLATGVCEKVTEDKPCPPGQVKNAEGKCVPIVTPPPPPPPPKTCPTGYVLVNGACVPIPTTTAPTTGVSAEGEKIDPIYAGAMEDFDLFATLQELLADDSGKKDTKKDSKKSKDKTKMATGGHLDDLLAEQMTVDDLLKLLR